MTETQPDHFSALLLDHLELLKQMGWWQEAEDFLLRHSSSLKEGELTAWLDYIREKKKIYQAEIPLKSDGLTYIGADDVVQLNKGAITISYHIKDRCLDIEHIFRSLKKAMQHVGNVLNYHPEDIFLHLHGQHSQIQGGNLNDNENQASIIGLYDGHLRLNAGAFYSREPQKIAVMITHEYVHKAVADLSGNRAPTWLNEGLAVFLSQDLPLEYEQLLQKAVQENAYFPCQALSNNHLFVCDRDTSTLAYAQSCSLVQFLREKIDWTGMQALLADLRNCSMEEALQQYSLNQYLLEREWRRWFRWKK
ncbi:MAG: peptidase MA family metallohydrolase [Desulfohalobiaceae bacterium]